MEQNIQKKDAWNVAYKNFLHISYFGGFIFLVFLVLYVMKVEQVKAFISIWLLVTPLVATGVWYYLAQMFKKRDKKAIPFGYTLLSVMLALDLYYSGINIVMILIFGYLLYLVYKASKAETIISA
ncbi:MAG: hypothetical protein WCI89_01375 [bacterium]